MPSQLRPPLFSSQQIRMYTIGRSPTGSFSGLWNRFQRVVERTAHRDPHRGLIIAEHHFKYPYFIIDEVELACLAAMDLLVQFIYPALSGGDVKFTITYTILLSSEEGEITFTQDNAIPLISSGKKIPLNDVYAQVYKYIKKYTERYAGAHIVRLIVRAYMTERNPERSSLSPEERYSILSSIDESGSSGVSPIPPKEIRNRKKSYPPHITALKSSHTKLKAFMVADIETIMIDNVHKPYAAGLLVVCPGKELSPIRIDTYFSEDYSIILDSFEERSRKVLYDFIERVLSVVRGDNSLKTIYFHNLSRFDGIFLLKHLICYHKYKLKPILRNHRLYELAVYNKTKKGKKFLFRFRDSLNLLPGSLNSLAKNLCPELGSKGSIEHDRVKLSNLASMKQSLLEYMKQDVLLLGGIMKKAQEIYWELYRVDIESKITFFLIGSNRLS